VPADQLAVTLAALAGLLLPHAPRADPRRLLRPGGVRGTPAGRRSAAVARRPSGRADAPSPDVAVPTWVPRACGAAAGLALFTGHGGWATMLGVATGALAAPGVAASAGRRRRLAASARALPRVADLLAAGLQAGLPLPAAADEVARVVDESTARQLRRLVVGLRSPADGGADRVDGWWRLERAVVRAGERGAPLADVLTALATDERERARWAAEEAARRAGVRAVGPLVACFLPAFVLVGVVPVVVGVAGTVLGDLR
jgi:Flp pilus assembly protein TadB